MLLSNLFVTLVLIGNGDPAPANGLAAESGRDVALMQLAEASPTPLSYPSELPSLAEYSLGEPAYEDLAATDCAPAGMGPDGAPPAAGPLRVAATELLSLFNGSDADPVKADACGQGDPAGFEHLASLDGLEGDFTSYETHGDFLGGLDTPASTEMEWSRHAIRRGETLSDLWNPVWNLPTATLYQLLEDREVSRALNRLRVGQEIEWRVDPEGGLERLRLWKTAAEGLEWVRRPDGVGFDVAEIRNEPEISRILVASEVRGSMANALAGVPELSRSAASSLAVLLDRHLPLRERAREGDAFTLLIEEERLSGDTEPHSVRLLAFDYRGQSLNMTAARHTNGRYYRPDGTSLLPPFDRRPFTGNYRISSSFDQRRRHPVTGRVAPHRGTDFAMPVGTPILAPADGVVSRVDYGPYNGRFIVLSHGQGYSTVYLHLQRALVQQGQRIARGDRIGLSGNTGRTTGPHLHYELHVNGRAVDAMRAELPSSDSLVGDDLREFQANAGPLLAEIRDGNTRQLAMQPGAGGR